MIQGLLLLVMGPKYQNCWFVMVQPFYIVVVCMLLKLDHLLIIVEYSVLCVIID